MVPRDALALVSVFLDVYWREGFLITMKENLEVKEQQSVELSVVRQILTREFTWVADTGGVVINAGSTIGGALGHDVDIVIVFNGTSPKNVWPEFARSIESMETVIREVDNFRPTFSFSRVAWQDLMAELRKEKKPDTVEPLGIHFLWYASPEQLLIAEPRGLALGLVNGEILLGQKELVEKTKTLCPQEDCCELWSGLDSVLDPIRLVANPDLEIRQLAPTIGHTIERFVIWDILAKKVRQKKGFDLVTRRDIHQERREAGPLLQSVLETTRAMRDAPKTICRAEIILMAAKIINGWEELRR